MCVCLTSVKKHGTTDKTERRQRGSIKRRKEMEQEVRWRRRRRRRLVSVPLSPIPFPSLLPPLIPHLLSCSVSFPLCIFLPMIPYTWLPPPSLASFKELFPPPPPPLSRGHIFCSQVADVTKH